GRDLDGVAVGFHVVHTGSYAVRENAQLVGEVHAAFLVDDEIFRTSKAAAFEFIGEDGLRGRDHGDLRRIPPQYNRAALGVERKIVDPAGVLHVGRNLPVLVDLENVVG